MTLLDRGAPTGSDLLEIARRIIAKSILPDLEDETFHLAACLNRTDLDDALRRDAERLLTAVLTSRIVLQSAFDDPQPVDGSTATPSTR